MITKRRFLSLAGPAGMIVIYPHVYKTLGYDVLHDFAPVTTVCDYPLLLTVGPRVPAAVKTLADFIAWCKVNPKEASYATGGAGSMLHFTGMMLGRAAGFEFVHVPYGGRRQLRAGCSRGSDRFMHFRDRPRACLCPGGRPASPDNNRAAAEPVSSQCADRESLGYPQLEATEWFGVLVPAKTPAEIVNSLNAAIRDALKADAVKTGMAQFAYEAAPASLGDPVNLLWFVPISEEERRWPSIKAANG